jgi:hypothetical protein
MFFFKIIKELLFVAKVVIIHRKMQKKNGDHCYEDLVKSGYIPKMKYKIFKNLIYIYILATH